MNPLTCPSIDQSEAVQDFVSTGPVEIFKYFVVLIRSDFLNFSVLVRGSLLVTGSQLESTLELVLEHELGR